VVRPGRQGTVEPPGWNIEPRPGFPRGLGAFWRTRTVEIVVTVVVIGIPACDRAARDRDIG
jgi:hypothetical protein